ncbi:MAG: DNA polymerase I [Oscillospiraceae bacterium]|nr:DNA polymerase I [Oscillospiraceae bacterium]
MENKSKVMFIIDGNSLINREYYGMPQLSTKSGIYTNAVLGFTNKLIKYIEQLSPDYAAVAFDLPAPTFRHLAYSGYKASRKGMPDELAMQLPYVKDLCGIFGFSVLTKEGFEADDIIGTVAKRGEQSGVMTYILTGDRDSFQLISDNVTVFFSSNTSVTEYNHEKILSEYGVEPNQLIDVKSLMGDASDEIPGVKGIGEKTALKLVQENNSLEEIYNKLDGGKLQITPANKQKLTDGRENAFMSRKLAEICCTVPVYDGDFIQKKDIDRVKLYDFCKKLELNSIIKKLNLSASEQINLFDGFDNIDPKSNTDYKIKFEDINICDVSSKLKDGELLFITPDFDSQSIYINNGELFFKSTFENISDLTSVFSGKFKICTRDIKNIYLELKKHGIIFENNIFAFDFELAGYVLNPSETKYETASLVYRYLDMPDRLENPDKYTENAVYCELYNAMSQKLKELELENLYYEVEIPLAFVLGDMEDAGFLIDSDSLFKFGEELNKKSEAMQREIYALAGEEFNINSPKQLGEILFDKLKLPYGKKGKNGHYGTNIDVMFKLMDLHPAVPLILEYRAVTKLKSTYCDGLIKLVDSHGRLHTSFNQTITATGRLSSTEPNLQNIPVRTSLGKEIRKFFIADNFVSLESLDDLDDLNGGRVLVDADYSQIELRVLAHISGDETLINAFRNNIDIHRLTASQVFGVPENEVTSEMRRKAKAVNFGIVYGISDFSLSEDIGVSVAEARHYIESYFLKYPKVKEFMDNVISSAKDSGYVKTILNRIRYIPELKGTNKNIVSFGERVARNTPIQGSAADIIKLAMLACHKRFKQENLKSKLILQVHDELIFETEKSELETVKEIVKHEMENVYQMSVPLIADISVGRSWYETKE